ncbi:hypothetical protein GCM10009718_02620 [Isoptericola halotolerans]
MPDLTRESRPRLEGGVSNDHVGAGSTSTIPPFLDGYEIGVLHGIALGRRQLEEEIAETQRLGMARGLQAMAVRAAGAYLPGVAP